MRAKGKAVIAQLVDECVFEIDEYRDERQAKEAEEVKQRGHA